MPRDYEIKDAFSLAIKRDARGCYTVSTLDFVKELHQLNWHFTPREANRWIEAHKSVFRDISASEGEERIFQVFNPNGGL
ncbi:DNA polymerase V [Pantoea agglomerans]|uniref:DNA polymerase V n=1 Tax=Enterobacter agglomerans TaxID=549 RepID=UPI00320AE4F1